MPSVRSGFKRFKVMSKQPLRQRPGEGTAARKTLMIPASLLPWRGSLRPRCAAVLERWACRVVARSALLLLSVSARLRYTSARQPSSLLRCGPIEPKMTASKRMTRTAFEVMLEMLRLLKRFKCNIDFQLPRYKLGRVNTSAAIVFRHTLLQIRGMSNIAFSRTTQAFNDVSVEHHADMLEMACHP